MTEVEVSDWARLDASGQPGKILVQLDGKKSFQDNAKACFKQARKIMNSHEKVGPMLKEKRAELECWRVHAEKAAGWKEEAGSSDGLSAESATLVLELYDAMLEQGIIKVKLPPVAPLLDLEEEQRLAFKRKYGKDIDCYRTPGGHEVIAGRSSKMNDYVSTKLAKGDMMWFHTDRGIPGSHVLIKAPWSEISEEDVEFAARLAAYHSKAKDDHHVPVMYCAGGSVRKPKGARTGQVTCTGRTYSIVVTPGHPDDA
ncbi:unnamed protein product [Prorocentrum cordatum]|uniref:NFACT RNA-binding domain-containing protein n=1 Tax=Prorocentrum cordatum TaxID=2364126 RepID=A0ABN9WTX3_9DINO|nr:unnamed protein product [Polarella glacialis]